LLVAPLLFHAGAAAEVQEDDPRDRLEATRAWRGDYAAGRERVLEAASRERDRYAVGRRPTAAGRNALVASSTSAFVNVGPTRADFAVNGDTFHEIDSGRVRQIVAHPVDPDVLYLATSGGGVWKTYNATSPTIRWDPLTDALGTTSVGALAMDPSNPDILFLGFGDPFDVQQPGLVRSTDAGGTWSAPAILKATYPVGTTGNVQLTAGSVTDIKVDPRNSQVVLATTDVGLFRSIDGGSNFTHVPLASLTHRFFFMWSLAYVGDDSWLVTGVTADLDVPPNPAAAGSFAIWRSTDDGLTWGYAAAALPGGESTAGLAGRATLATAASTLADPASTRVYLLTGTSNGIAQRDVLRSDDAGLTFLSLQVDNNHAPTNPNADQRTLDILNDQAWYNQALLVDPADPDTVFIGGQLSMARSTDGGRRWSILSNWLPHNSENNNIDRPYVHADLHAFAVGADGTFYAGSDGGIAFSRNALSATPEGVSFDSAHNEGLVTHLAYSVVCAPRAFPAGAQGFLAGGLQDNGTRLRAGTSTTFNMVLGGDGIGLAVSNTAHRDPTLQIDVPDVFLASVPGAVFRSGDGGQTFNRFTTGLARLPFLVRMIGATEAAGQYFLTFSGAPAGVYKWHVDDLSWSSVSGALFWVDSGQSTAGFTTVDGAPIALRNLAAHPRQSNAWAAVSNKFTYLTTDGGMNWQVGVQPRPANTPPGSPGAYLLTSVEFDPRDANGNTYYVSTIAAALVDPQNNFHPYPPDFGHVFRTSDAGRTWQSVGAQDVATGGLPNVGVNVIKVDPDDPATIYVGTEIGLYRSTDAGQTWSRFGAGTLPLVEVTDVCIAPGSQRLAVSTYGRGFWEIDMSRDPTPAGFRGVGDTNFDGRIDGEDLIDLDDGFGATQSSPVYRWQADLVGVQNQIDSFDLSALLAKFGGTP